MRPRTAILSLSAFFVVLYPLLMWQKKRFFSSSPIMEGIVNSFWIAEPLLLALFFFASAAAIRQKILQYLCIIAASFLFTFAAAEMYFNSLPIDPLKLEFDSYNSAYVKSGQATHLYEKSFRVPDPVLGYGPSANGTMRIAARRMSGGEVLYDVLYSRDEEGRRITPDRGDKADTAILLFGCSFTVGYSLNDQETFAWQLGEILGEKFQVFNYGFHGYGPQHMLALIESGRLDSLVRRYKQICALYLTISDHVDRTVGPRPFYVGPRYILENGAIKYAGMFSHTVDSLFAHSQVYKRVKPAYYKWLAYDRALNTYIAIVTKSMHELAVRYRAHALTVIYPDFTRIEPVLQAHGVRTLSLSAALPDFAAAPEKYVLKLKVDEHPNALANTRIAEALAEYILKNAQATGKTY